LASPRTSRVLPPGAARSRRSAVLMLTGLLAARSPLPYTAVALIPLVWAGVEVVLSIRERSAARSTPPSPSRGIVSGVVSLVLVCALTVVVLLPYAFYDTVKTLQDCTLGANTSIAAADCNIRYQRSLNSTLGGLLIFGQRAGG